MFKLVLLTLVLVLVLVTFVSCKPQLKSPKIKLGNNGRIIGGQNAAPHEFPWQVSLQCFEEHICGGTIINEKQVLTAAHCVEAMVLLEYCEVLAGAHFLLDNSDTNQKVGISKAEANMDFSVYTLRDDVGIITIQDRFVFNENVQPIKMFNSEVDAEPQPGTRCTNSGWGVLETGSQDNPNPLQFIKIPIVDEHTCQNSYGLSADIFQGHICAGYRGGGPCNGDSGGPLICPTDVTGQNGYKLAGIVSFGSTDCASVEAVFTRVSYYEKWISDRIITA